MRHGYKELANTVAPYTLEFSVAEMKIMYKDDDYALMKWVSNAFPMHALCSPETSAPVLLSLGGPHTQSGEVDALARTSRRQAALRRLAGLLDTCSW